MRYVTVPEPIKLYEPISGKPFQVLDEKAEQPTLDQRRAGAQQITKDDEPVDFYKWLKSFVLQDEKFNKGFSSWEMVSRIQVAFREATPGDVVAVDEGDWDLASDVAKEPTKTVYPTGLIACQYYSFIVAIAGTKDAPVPSKDPSKAEN